MKVSAALMALLVSLPAFAQTNVVSTNSVKTNVAKVTAAPTKPFQTTIKLGDKAPLVKGKDQDGKTWKLADSIGKKIVLLYFYPKDETPGCTKEACGLRDGMADMQKANVEVVGVSFDAPDSHQKFIAKYKLNFKLIADVDGKIVDTYGVRRKPTVKVARRVSFLIGLDGKVVHVTDVSDASVHLTEMKEAIAKLAKK